MGGYVGSSRDKQRLAKLDKEREAQRKKFEDAKKTAQNTLSLRQFGAAATEVCSLLVVAGLEPLKTHIWRAIHFTPRPPSRPLCRLRKPRSKTRRWAWSPVRSLQSEGPLLTKSWHSPAPSEQPTKLR